MFIKKFILVLMFFSAVCSLYSQEEDGLNPTATVMDFESQNLSENEMKAIISRLSSALFQTNVYDIIDVNQREMLLDELDFSLSGCIDESCMLELGKLLSAEYIVVGTINKVGNMLALTAKLIETETGKVIATADGTYLNTDEMLADLPNIAAKLAGLQENIILFANSKKGGKKTDPRVIWGWSCLGAGALSVAGGVFLGILGGELIYDYQTALDAYNNAGPGADFIALVQARDDAYQAAVDGNAELQFWSGIGLTAAGAGLIGLSIYLLIPEKSGDPVAENGLDLMVMPANGSISLQLKYSY